MKMKSMAMLAISGLLAASFAYVAPALAEDFGGDEQAMQTAAGDTTAAGDATGTTGQDGTAQTGNVGSGDSSVTGTNSENTDEGSPVQDTPSGDDDY